MSKIIAVHIESIRGIRYCDVKFDDKNWVPIFGENGAGKSSFLDACIFALTGNRTKSIVNNEASTGRAIIKLDNGTEIIREASGVRAEKLTLKQNGKLLDLNASELLNSLGASFIDPLHLARKDAKEIYAFLVKHSGIDFDAIDSEIATAEQNRLLAYRALKAFGEVSEPVKPANARVDLSEAIAKNKAHDEILISFKNLIVSCESIEQLIIWTEKRLAELKLVNCQNPIDTSEAYSMNMLWDQYDNDSAKYEAYLEADSEHYNTSELVKTLRENRLELAKGILKLDGYEEIDNELYVNKTIWSSLSTGERMREACKLSVSLLSELRVWFIRDASLLDSDSMLELEKLANELDIQVFLELVDTNLENGVFFYEGIGEVKKP